MGTSDLPLIGPWQAKLGRIDTILATPCAVTPMAFVKGGFQSAPHVIWTLFKPDPIDSRYDLFGRPHRRKRRRRVRGAGKLDRLFNTNGAGVTNAFKIGGLAQRAGWYMIVAEAYADLATNWTSAAYTYSGCDVNIGLNGEYDPSTIIVGPQTHGTLGNWSWSGSAPPIGVGPNGIFVPDQQNFTMGVHLSAGPASNGLKPQASITGVRVIDTLNPSSQPRYMTGSAGPTDDGYSAAALFAVKKAYSGNANLVVQIAVSPGYCSIVSSGWYCDTREGHGILPDP